MRKLLGWLDDFWAASLLVAVLVASVVWLAIDLDSERLTREERIERLEDRVAALEDRNAGGP